MVSHCGHGIYFLQLGVKYYSYLWAAADCRRLGPRITDTMFGSIPSRLLTATKLPVNDSAFRHYTGDGSPSWMSLSACGM